MEGDGFGEGRKRGGIEEREDSLFHWLGGGRPYAPYFCHQLDARAECGSAR